MEDRCYSMAPSRFPINTAFVEGWALYCENLGHDLGLYDDPYDRFGHLSEEIFRASRLVVDTGMHALGWSRDQAVAFMQDNTAASNDNINAEIDRYITWPGQAVGYKVGEIKISQLRKDAEEKLGSKFDIRDFHEVILKSAGPLNIVEQEVASFIKSKLSWLIFWSNLFLLFLVKYMIVIPSAYQCSKITENQTRTLPNPYFFFCCCCPCGLSTLLIELLIN